MAQLATARGKAQQRADPMLLEQAVVYSGSDIGFRVSDSLTGEPIGRLVVRMNGQWKEVAIRQPK
jgi:hypothetical protein